MDWTVIEAAGENVLDRFREDLRDIGLDIELFESRMGNWMRTPTPRLFPPTLKGGSIAPLSVEDKGNCFEVRMNLPGIPKELVGIKFSDQTLEIEAETKALKETERKSYVIQERLATESPPPRQLPDPGLAGEGGGQARPRGPGDQRPEAKAREGAPRTTGLD